MLSKETSKLSMDRIESEIVHVLDDFGNDSRGKSNEDWTKGIKEILVMKAKDFGYLVSANHCNGSDYPEWLFDLVWYEYSGDVNNEERKYNLLDIPLVLESEWGNRKDIIYDFEKLLIARSGHRVMIFQEKEREIQKLMDNLVGRIKAFKFTQKGDRYLFSGWCLYKDNKKNEFIHRLYIA